MSKSTFTPKSDSPVDNSEHENKSEASTVGHDVAPSFTVYGQKLSCRGLLEREVRKEDVRDWIDETLRSEKESLER